MADPQVHAVLCKSCGAQMVWTETERGKPMPVDLDTITGSNTKWVRNQFGRMAPAFNPDEGMMSHWATCAFPDQHRRPRTKS